MCRTGKYRELLFALAVSLPLMISGCITITTSDSSNEGSGFLTSNQQAALQGVQQALTVADVRNSFLFKSADIFYPDGMPQDPSQLPVLDANQLHILEEFISTASDRVADDTHRFQDVLKEIYGPTLVPTRVKRIALEQGDVVEARVDVDGTLYVSTNVVQAIYRGVLLDSLEQDQEAPKDAAARQQEEAAAFQAFDEMRKHLKSMSLAAPVNEIEYGLQGAEQTTGGAEDKIMGAAFNALAGELNDYLFIQRSKALSGAFFDAMVFVAGHELGHLELGHLPLKPVADICAEIGQHELDADRFSSILLALDQYADLTYNVQNDQDGIGWTINEPRDVSPGYEPFFKYAYGIAGFDDLRRPGDCVPPSADERGKRAAAQYGMATEVLNGAAFDRFLLGPWWMRLFGLHYSDEVSADPEKEFEEQYHEMGEPVENIKPDVHLNYSPDDLAAAKDELKSLFFYKFDP